LSHRRVYVSHDGEKWSAMSMEDALPLYGVACGSEGKLAVAGKKIMQTILPKSGLSN
jgi:hypothetical protein